MEDTEIVALYWERSERALAETQAKYSSYCRAIALRLLGDAGEAEETVNDALLAAWNAIPPHRPESLSAFLGKLTRRNAVNRWQARGAEKRGAFVLRYWYALPVKEVAVKFGWSVTKTTNLLSRLRAGLKAFLEKEGLL